MAASILTHTAILTARGMDEAFSQNLKALADSLRAMNAEQEELKGTLKEKTSELNAKMVELNKTVRSVHQIVKIDLPKERWTDFGINAKH
ncbi:MAG: hypothetical protein GY757_33500 [bacterium]|nr:hypothetical protein [bacterium]